MAYFWEWLLGLDSVEITGDLDHSSNMTLIISLLELVKSKREDWWECKMVHLLWNTVWRFYKKIRLLFGFMGAFL